MMFDGSKNISMPKTKNEIRLEEKGMMSIIPKQ